MSDKTKELEQTKANYIEKQKRLALLDAGISYDDVSAYVKYITATSNDGIKKEAEEIVADINGHYFADVYQDSRVWRPF